MPLLYHWVGENYRRDLDQGAAYHLNQSNPLLHEIDLGDSLWAFTRTPAGAYVLATELIVRAKTMNSHGYHYGPYRLWGDLTRSRYFQIEGQPDISEQVRRLSVRASAPVIGRSFQGHAAVRRLTSADHQVLVAYAQHLPLEPRARLLPEEELEGPYRPRRSRRSKPFHFGQSHGHRGRTTPLFVQTSITAQPPTCQGATGAIRRQMSALRLEPRLPVQSGSL